MSSHMHKLVKFIPFHHTLKWLSPCNTLLIFSQIWVILPSIRRAFNFYKFLPSIRRVFNFYKFLSSIRRAFSIINICPPCERAFVMCSWKNILICFKMCRDCKKYIYIYIYTCVFCDIWCLKIYEEYIWVFCEECVFKIYGSVR